jgi:hypothetical protein
MVVKSAILGFLVALCVGCASTSGQGAAIRPSAVAPESAPALTAVATTQPQQAAAMATDSSGGTTTASQQPQCPVPRDDQAPQKGECTLVDWDVIAVDGTSLTVRYFVNDPGCSLGLDRIETAESTSEVSLRVVVGFTGDEGATCPTSYSSRTSVVTLRDPLGARALTGCRPVGSFVPKGGYNSPEPRSHAPICLAL